MHLKESKFPDEFYMVFKDFQCSTKQGPRYQSTQHVTNSIGIAKN